MHCRLRSPDRTYYDGEATMVVARTPRGEFAVLEGHAPLLAQLREGPVRIKSADGEAGFLCGSGTLEVRNGEVTVLTTDVEAVKDIDLDALRSRADDVQATPEARAAATARLRMAERLRGQHA
ncbi:MAG: ATP synthase F1 subunit epsilon [Candidatus Bipolaricaulota bacterium]|nr:ATP synthase F1 subunit epsilon [Candidatus Bipolaricaulota bacterium]